VNARAPGRHDGAFEFLAAYYQADRWIHHQKTLFRGVPWSFEIQEVLQLKQREYFLTKGVLRDAEVAHERQLGTWEE
jgi:hypothetical protein